MLIIMKILFITYHFPPYNSVGAVRTSKTAKYLIEAGHEVKVLTCANQLLPSSLSLEIPKQNVEYASWFNINSPVAFILGGTKEDDIQTFLDNNAEYREQREREDVNIMKTLGNYAPAFGMIGTLIGLIYMLAGIETLTCTCRNVFQESESYIQLFQGFYF